VLIWDFVLQRDGLAIVSLALAIVLSLANELQQIEPGYKIFSILRSEGIATRLDIQQIV
jgi:hypothetical protein